MASASWATRAPAAMVLQQKGANSVRCAARRVRRTEASGRGGGGAAGARLGPLLLRLGLGLLLAVAVAVTLAARVAAPAAARVLVAAMLDLDVPRLAEAAHRHGDEQDLHRDEQRRDQAEELGGQGRVGE